jgi:hypothetical protein
MPRRPSHNPNALERQAMQLIKTDTLSVAVLNVGPVTVRNLLVKAWIESQTSGQKNTESLQLEKRQ